MKLISTITLIASITVSLSACSTISRKSKIDNQNDQQIPEVVVVPEIKKLFQVGDTLWDFAERNTGSGFNWEQIKAANQIEDETKIDAGVELIVPFELALESLKSN